MNCNISSVRDTESNVNKDFFFLIANIQLKPCRVFPICSNNVIMLLE